MAGPISNASAQANTGFVEGVSVKGVPASFSVILRDYRRSNAEMPPAADPNNEIAETR